MEKQIAHSFIASAAFGLEGVVAAELKRMGLSSKAEQGGARFYGSYEDAFRANLWLRTADRVLLILKEKKVYSFEELFRLISSISWESLLPKDACIPVSGKCVRSRLMSVRDCQAITKKAICSRLQRDDTYSRLPEIGAIYPIDVSIHRDEARITLNMSGDALHRRGYRTWNGSAPLRETLAAALVEISSWKGDMPLYDPCCGTGTLLIEAAHTATKRAPGLSRTFACENFHFMSKRVMTALRQEAAAAYMAEFPINISGSDIDPKALDLCAKHIRQASLEAKIHTCQMELRRVQRCESRGVFLVNPPYGERLGNWQQCHTLYKALGDLSRRHPGWSMGVIISNPAFERFFGRKAHTKRRLYNGRLECEFFLFPPGKT